MKKIFRSFIVLIVACASLVGCGMNNQDAGTLTGALAGGLIGSTVGRGGGQILAIATGTVAGAVIGNAVGRNMDEVDRMRMEQALENNDLNEPAYWRNAHSGARYEVVPIRNTHRGRYRYCREYRTTANIGGKRQQVYGTACRQPDGSWRMVS